MTSSIWLPAFEAENGREHRHRWAETGRRWGRRVHACARDRTPDERPERARRRRGAGGIFHRIKWLPSRGAACMHRQIDLAAALSSQPYRSPVRGTIAENPRICPGSQFQARFADRRAIGAAYKLARGDRGKLQSRRAVWPRRAAGGDARVLGFTNQCRARRRQHPSRSPPATFARTSSMTPGAAGTTRLSTARPRAGQRRFFGQEQRRHDGRPGAGPCLHASDACHAHPGAHPAQSRRSLGHQYGIALLNPSDRRRRNARSAQEDPVRRVAGRRNGQRAGTGRTVTALSGARQFPRHRACA